MMNRKTSKDSLIGIGGRNLHTNGIHNAPVTGLLSHRRVMSYANTTTTAEDFNSSNVDLLSRNRRSLSVASSDESDLRLARLPVGSTKPAKSVLDDLLSSNEGGKHDYDWLLTPPGTPLLPCSDGKESQPTSIAPRNNSSVRSGSTIKSSRLSVSQSESSHPSRPARSSSATRSSISTTQYTNYSNRNSNILNTSCASVSSYIRPSTPTHRSSSAARPSTASSRTTTSRASTPSRTRPSPSTTSIDRTIRPSTPTPRMQTRGSLTSPTIRPASRPSTPTRRSPTPSLAPSTTSSPSAGRALSSNGRNAGSTSRPSSPGSRIRPPPQPIILPDFPLETPPNLRTTLPERPLSAGRSRPGAAMTVKGHVETTNSGSMTRRQSSPIITRGRLTEPPARGRPHANGQVVETLESRRTLHVPESLTRKPIKMSNSESATGFGRSISKKSLDMAIKHMDIRNGGIRPLSGSTLFPQSIRSGNPRMQPGRASSAPGSVDGSFSNGVSSKNGNFNNGYLENKVIPVSVSVSVEHRGPYSSKLAEADMYESSRYDAILLKEDLKNTSWLHSADENSDQGPFFDNGFEPLPEPFGPL